MGNRGPNPMGKIFKNRTEKAGHPSLRSERGAIYLEAILSLMMISMVIPVFFFAAQLLRQEVDKQIEEQRLRGEYLTFLSFAQRELKTANQFRVQQGALLFELPTGETVRYEQKKGQIVRQRKQVDSPHFQGHTVLLQYVDQVFFTPDQQGVAMTIYLKKKKVVAIMETYITARKNDER